MGATRYDASYEVGTDDGFGEVLPTFPDVDVRSKHPWGQWTDGKVRVLARGKNFQAGDARGMRSTIYGYARRNDIAVRVRLGRPASVRGSAVQYVRTDRFLTVQFFPGRPYGHTS